MNEDGESGNTWLKVWVLYLVAMEGGVMIARRFGGTGVGVLVVVEGKYPNLDL